VPSFIEKPIFGRRISVLMKIAWPPWPFPWVNALRLAPASGEAKSCPDQAKIASPAS
jgi:hypothetical protein